MSSETKSVVVRPHPNNTWRAAQERHSLLPRANRWSRHGAANVLVARLLGPVLRTALPSILDAGGVQRPPNNVVLHTREVLHTPTPNEHNRVLLKIVTLSRDVGRHLIPIGQANARDLPKRRVRLLRRGRIHTRADTAPLWTSLERGGITLLLFALSPLPNELLYCRHVVFASQFRSSGNESGCVGNPPNCTASFSRSKCPRWSQIRSEEGMKRPFPRQTPLTRPLFVRYLIYRYLSV